MYSVGPCQAHPVAATAGAWPTASPESTGTFLLHDVEPIAHQPTPATCQGQPAAAESPPRSQVARPPEMETLEARQYTQHLRSW